MGGRQMTIETGTGVALVRLPASLACLMVLIRAMNKKAPGGWAKILRMQVGYRQLAKTETVNLSIRNVKKPMPTFTKSRSVGQGLATGAVKGARCEMDSGFKRI